MLNKTARKTTIKKRLVSFALSSEPIIWFTRALVWSLGFYAASAVVQFFVFFLYQKIGADILIPVYVLSAIIGFPIAISLFLGFLTIGLFCFCIKWAKE